jgi:DNA-binding FrmR family transcriptional regulator
MEEGTRADANMRLKRIAGQVAGIERMLADDRYCVDILLQIAAVQGALGEVGRVVLASHVQTCLAEALAGGNAKERRTKVDELVNILSRCSVTGATPRARSQTTKARVNVPPGGSRRCRRKRASPNFVNRLRVGYVLSAFARFWISATVAPSSPETFTAKPVPVEVTFAFAPLSASGQ